MGNHFEIVYSECRRPINHKQLRFDEFQKANQEMPSREVFQVGLHVYDALHANFHDSLLSKRLVRPVVAGVVLDGPKNGFQKGRPHRNCPADAHYFVSRTSTRLAALKLHDSTRLMVLLLPSLRFSSNV